MGERLTPAPATRFYVEWTCDECDGLVYTRHAVVYNIIPLYVHQCCACGKMFELEKEYPCIEWREKE